MPSHSFLTVFVSLLFWCWLRFQKFPYQLWHRIHSSLYIWRYLWFEQTELYTIHLSFRCKIYRFPFSQPTQRFKQISLISNSKINIKAVRLSLPCEGRFLYGRYNSEQRLIQVKIYATQNKKAFQHFLCAPYWQADFLINFYIICKENYIKYLTNIFLVL